MRTLTVMFLLVHLACCQAGNSGDPAVLNQIYARAGVQFQKASFYKPAEIEADRLWFKLAPLIIQEVQTTDSLASQADRFGALELQGKRLHVESSKPTVYFWTDTEINNGAPHARFSYLWFYPPLKAQPQGTGPRFQGVRMTLNSAGEPVVWETLADNSGKEIIYVAESLEAAALSAHGQALLGRKFAIEHSPTTAPNTVVARVIDDGPVPMGPIVYVGTTLCNLATLICRCMPAQAKSLTQTGTYHLVSANSEPARAALQHFKSTFTQPIAFWPDQANSEPLQERLRLPGTF